MKFRTPATTIQRRGPGRGAATVRKLDTHGTRDTRHVTHVTHLDTVKRRLVVRMFVLAAAALAVTPPDSCCSVPYCGCCPALRA